MEKNILPPVLGTTIKIAVSAELGNNEHMSNVNFSCTVFNANTKSNSVTLEKSEMTCVDDDTYIAVVDTSTIGSGEYYVTFSADIPDTDCPNGIRKEIVTVPTGIKVKIK